MSAAKNRTAVALIGCGEHARVDLLPSIRQIPTVRLTAICDPDEANLEVASALLDGVELYTDYRELMDGTKGIGAVVVAAPPQVHTDVAEIAMRHRIHVFCEKPPATTTAELQRLAQIGGSTGVVTAIGHNFRYAAAFLALSGLLKTERLLGFDVRYLASGPKGDRWGLGSPTRSFLLTHVTHVVDLVICTLGAPDSVVATAVKCEAGGMLLSAQLNYTSGSMSSILVGDVAPSLSLDVWGATHSGMSVHLESLRSVRCSGRLAEGARWSEVWRPRTLEAGYRSSGYLGELEAFFSAVHSGGSASPSFTDEMKTYRVIDEIESQIVR
jgi:phthalate 4,5-cis-dihydrodiol dehydrogenase